MEQEIYSLHKLLKNDTRYPLPAYVFVREALGFASDSLNLGETSQVETELQLDLEAATAEPDPPLVERHLTGQELCEAIRLYAIQEFGYMAKVVLDNWGIRKTQDFGNIVYNMIDVGLMKKSPRDSRAHFDDVYDFEIVFDRDFEMKISEP